jgi:hypothetical protein
MARNKKSDSPRALGTVSTSELAKEMVKRQQRVQILKQKRDKVLAQVHELDEQIRAEGGSLRGSSLHSFSAAEAPSQGRKRFLNKSNLVDALAATLKGRELGVTEIAYAVVKDGYKTTAANFRTIVNQTLIRFPDRFKKVRRGVYTSKG